MSVGPQHLWPADRPVVPTGQLLVEAPPEVEATEGPAGVLSSALPVVGSVASIALMTQMGSQHGTSSRTVVAAAAFVLASVAFVVLQVDRQRQQRLRRMNDKRADYLGRLHETRTHLRELAGQQRRALLWHHPDPACLPLPASHTDRLWEAPRGDAGPLPVRYGLARLPLSVDLAAPPTRSGSRTDPGAAAAARRLVGVHASQSHLPACLDLRDHTHIAVSGPAERSRSLLRALVCSAAACHPPGALMIAALVAEEHLERWDWLKWLPHNGHPHHGDAAGARRLLSSDPQAWSQWGLTHRPPDSRHLLLVVDGHPSPPTSAIPARMTSLALLAGVAPGVSEAHLRFETKADTVLFRGPGMTTARAIADHCDLTVAEAFARRLAGQATSNRDLPAPTDVMRLLDVDDLPGLDVHQRWSRTLPDERLRVPLGHGETGVVHLDLKESAEGGAGPHGLVVGATGSGKSELLRSLVLALALGQSPAQLNLVLVDFKGGATFAGLAALPHVSAMVTNLIDDVARVDRMQEALTGELERRQVILRAAGDVCSRAAYEAAREAGAELAPLPALVIVVDEFSELLSARPEFIETFTAVGRLGRSLGLHLLLASQRLDEGRLRGLESHLSYRIALRTFSAADSRAVLGSPIAHELPPEPGAGFLQTGTAKLQRFHAVQVSGPLPNRDPVTPRTVQVLPFTAAVTPDPATPGAPATRRPAVAGSILDVAVSRLAEQGPSAHQIWLPPLDLPDTLDALLPDLVSDPALGLVSPHWRARGFLTVPVGRVDRPKEQRRDPLLLDFAGSGGHLVVVGAPRSGRSTLMRTVVCALALVATPHEVQFFVLDFGGSSFASLAVLPHVAAIATRATPDVVRRIVAEVGDILDAREKHFAAHDLDSVHRYRDQRHRGEVGDGWGDVFLVIDGWSTLRSDFEDLEPTLQQLADRGLTFGVHLLATTSRWSDIRPASRDLFGSRLELRLGDPLDSEIDRQRAQRVPHRPGRGLVPDKGHFLAALPRLDGQSDPSTLRAGVDHLVSRSRAAWPGSPAPRLRMLPTHVDLEEVRRAGDHSPGLLVGLAERELAPVTLDCRIDPHTLIFGEAGSGKTALLHTICHEIARTRSPSDAQVVVVDPRRSLQGAVAQPQLLHHLTDPVTTGTVLSELAVRLVGRLPGPSGSSAPHRHGWRGPEVFVIVDDYDLMVGSPLAPLIALFPRAHDVGLRVLLARRSGGAARGAFEPVMQSLRELGAAGFLLSGSPDEGALVGGHRCEPALPGRAQFITRGRGALSVQIACVNHQRKHR
ncbi:type VII secretion protein EccCb [Nocardioides sp.]|uniref:type VII secretion protein EccCb n=1 Tax=Nocardioides sp. TaxID=35761 RepID=UPI003D136A66